MSSLIRIRQFIPSYLTPAPLDIKALKLTSTRDQTCSRGAEPPAGVDLGYSNYFWI